MEHEAEREHDRIEVELRRSDTSSDPFAAAVRATRMPMLITDPAQQDNPIVFVNDAFCRLTRYARSEILGRNCRFLQGPETDPRSVVKIRDAIVRRVPIEIEILNHKKNGELFWNRLLISPVFDESGELTYYFASQFDVTLERDKMVRLQNDRDLLEREAERRSADLRFSEDRLGFVLKAGRLGSWTLELSRRRLIASDICKETFGRQPGEPFTYDDLLASIAADDLQRMQSAVATSIERNTDYEIEYRIITPSGERKWVQIRGRPFYSAQGEPLLMTGVSIDITARKREEEHRLLLVDELNHRVKNSLATVQSIADQTLRTSPSIPEARSAFAARLQSLAGAHDVLTRRSWSSATIGDVVEGALAPFMARWEERFAIGGPRIELLPRSALTVAMALHELGTNASKFGALSNDRGRVILNWHLDTDILPARFRLTWQEVDGPTVNPPTRVGFGSRMIERALAAELAGTAIIEFLPAGVVFTLDAPLTPPSTPG